MSPSLADRQAEIRRALLASGENALLAAFGGTGSGPSVYRNTVQQSLRDALAELYPVVRRLIGADCFAGTSAAFVGAHPPQSPVLSTYGGAFPDFLESFAPLQGLIYLGDVARFELALRDVYHGAEATPLDPARLAALTEQDLLGARLTLHPASRLLRSRFPVRAIWTANQDSNGTPEPIRLDDVGCRVLTIRPFAQVELHDLSPGGFVFTEAIATGATLGDAFQCAEARDPGFDVFSTLAALAAGRCFTALQTEDSGHDR